MQNTITKTFKSDKKISYMDRGINNSFYFIEKRLAKVFKDEMESENSIFKSVSSNVIHKMAMFLTGITKRSCSIGIAGETASGKSTIAYDIINTLEAFAIEFGISDLITRINTDDYYYDRSDMVKAAGSFAEFHSVQEGFPLAPLDAAIFPVNRLHQQAVFFMPV